VDRCGLSNREVVVELTPKATALVARLIPIAHKLEDAAAQGLSKKERADLKRALRRMHENLNRRKPPPWPG
jgi:DNA-binding MarR family transcriptional regulator